MALDGDFPMLEHLYIRPFEASATAQALSKTFQAPHLRHLILQKFAFPDVSVAAAAALVMLSLKDLHPHFLPDEMIQRLSLMPHLETLSIVFSSPIYDREVVRQLLGAPIMTHAMLPSLCTFRFTGPCAYLEAILPQITTPRLEELSVIFFKQPPLSLPHLLQFIVRTEDLRFGEAGIRFSSFGVDIRASSQVGARVYNLEVVFMGGQPELDLQMAWAAQISNTLSTVLSEVVDLTLSFSDSGVLVDYQYEAPDDVELPPWR